MEGIWQAGIQFIAFLQGLGSWLEAPMNFFSFLGNEEFYLIFAPLIYWCVDASLGFRLGLILMASSSLNASLKLLIHLPRPGWFDPRVQALSIETTFGIPSGHAQNAIVLWGYLANWLRRGWGWGVCGALILMIGISRLYLGVHFPTDVLAGWVIGGALLWGYLRFEQPLRERLKNSTVNDQIILALAASLALAMLGSLSSLALIRWQIPANWIENAVRALPEGTEFNPLSLSTVFTSTGTFFGLAAGYVLLLARGGFDARGTLLARILRFVLGGAGTLIIWMGLGAIFPRGEYLLAFGLRYLRYALLGAWVTYLAPLVFIRLRLAKHRL